MLLALAACSESAPQNVTQPQDLESAAIERGLVRDPKDTEIVGLYARDTDRICVLHSAGEYRIGAFVDYGDGITCSGAGSVTRAGERLHLRLSDACSFDARLEGDKLAVPGALPDGCKALCSQRASFAGLEVSRMSESAAEAEAMRDASGKRLCGD